MIPCKKKDVTVPACEIMSPTAQPGKYIPGGWVVATQDEQMTTVGLKESISDRGGVIGWLVATNDDYMTLLCNKRATE